MAKHKQKLSLLFLSGLLACSRYSSAQQEIKQTNADTAAKSSRLEELLKSDKTSNRRTSLSNDPLYQQIVDYLSKINQRLEQLRIEREKEMAVYSGKFEAIKSGFDGLEAEPLNARLLALEIELSAVNKPELIEIRNEVAEYRKRHFVLGEVEVKKLVFNKRLNNSNFTDHISIENSDLCVWNKVNGRTYQYKDYTTKFLWTGVRIKVTRCGSGGQGYVEYIGNINRARNAPEKGTSGTITTSNGNRYFVDITPTELSLGTVSEDRGRNHYTTDHINSVEIDLTIYRLEKEQRLVKR